MISRGLGQTPVYWSIVAWLTGCAILHHMPELPHPAWLLIAAGLCVGSIRWRWPTWSAALILGWSWAAGMAWWSQPPVIADLDTQTTYQAQGVVVGVPTLGAKYTRLLFRVNQLQQAETTQQGDWLIRATWLQPPDLQVGTEWQLSLRLKPAQSYHNPGSWDYAGWLYHQGIRYTGYVVTKGKAPTLLEDTGCCPLQQLRQHWRETLRALQFNPDVTGIYLALTLGDRSGLSTQLKQTFAATGTSHLMAISGLHIGLAAAVAVMLVTGGWRCIPKLCARYPAILAGTIAGLIIAAGYAAIAGFGLPAQRALIMLAVFAFALLQRRATEPFHVLALAAFAVTMVQPAAVLSAGFWLSFGAVAAILWLLPQLRGRHWLCQAIGVQLGISLMLYPVLLLYGMPVSWLAPLINLILVPIFGFVVVPLSLLGVLTLPWVPLAGELLSWLAILVQLILAGLTWLAQWAQWQYTLPMTGFRWMMLGAVILLLVPIPLRWRSIGLLLLGLGQLPLRTSIAPGDYQLTVLDVGQGLSVVVQTQNHTLVYDTGAAYPSGFNLADAVILPYLREQGVTTLSMLMLSHGDNDHDGAASALVAHIPVHEVLAGEPERTPLSAKPCVAGQTWTWDGVEFSVLQPGLVRPAVSNNASCVVQIRNAAGATLLTGDIKAQVERRLVPKVAPEAPYQVVVAAHHGSLSSSSPAFIQAVQAHHVVYPVGALNRYGFPKAEVVARWHASGAQGWRTDQTGAIAWLFQHTGTLEGPTVYRHVRKRYWHQSNITLD